MNSPVMLGRCTIASTAVLRQGAVIGKAFRPLINETTPVVEAETVISDGVYVGYYSLVGAGSTLLDGVVLDDFAIVENGVTVGARSLLIYKAHVCNDATVGSGCVIGGLVAERVIVEAGARVFGKIVHKQDNPALGWDSPDAEEGSARIGAGAFLGFDSLVVGDVSIGAGAYVCAGAIVTRDVPDRFIAYGINTIIPASSWRGRLKDSTFFHRGH